MCVCVCVCFNVRKKGGDEWNQFYLKMISYSPKSLTETLSCHVKCNFLIALACSSLKQKHTTYKMGLIEKLSPRSAVRNRAEVNNMRTARSYEP